MIIPEFDKEFYTTQVEQMCARYEKIFKIWKLNWIKFYNFVSSKLNNNTYRIWIFLFGLEPIIKSCNFKPSKKEKLDFLQENSKKRIYQIIKDDEKIKFFLKNI
ncbi:MAG: hypothetical protein WCJ72_02410 [Chryseobacterium sp.]